MGYRGTKATPPTDHAREKGPRIIKTEANFPVPPDYFDESMIAEWDGICAELEALTFLVTTATALIALCVADRWHFQRVVTQESADPAVLMRFMTAVCRAYEFIGLSSSAHGSTTRHLRRSDYRYTPHELRDADHDPMGELFNED